MIHGPNGGGLRYRVKPFQIFQANAGAIVIAANRGAYLLPNPINHRIRVRTVANQISATKDLIVLTRCVLQHSLQSFPIAV